MTLVEVTFLKLLETKTCLLSLGTLKQTQTAVFVHVKSFQRVFLGPTMPISCASSSARSFVTLYFLDTDIYLQHLLSNSVIQTLFLESDQKKITLISGSTVLSIQSISVPYLFLHVNNIQPFPNWYNILLYLYSDKSYDGKAKEKVFSKIHTFTVETIHSITWQLMIKNYEL